MANPRKAISLPRSGRLRPVARMVSGPNVLPKARFAALHLRWDRERFGDTGPASAARWSHLVAILAGAVIALALAGAH